MTNEERLERKQKALNDLIKAFENLGQGLKEAKKATSDLTRSLENWKFTKK